MYTHVQPLRYYLIIITRCARHTLNYRNTLPRTHRRESIWKIHFPNWCYQNRTWDRLIQRPQCKSMSTNFIDIVKKTVLQLVTDFNESYMRTYIRQWRLSKNYVKICVDLTSLMTLVDKAQQWIYNCVKIYNKIEAWYYILCINLPRSFKNKFTYTNENKRIHTNQWIDTKIINNRV